MEALCFCNLLYPKGHWMPQHLGTNLASTSAEHHQLESPVCTNHHLCTAQPKSCCCAGWRSCRCCSGCCCCCTAVAAQGTGPAAGKRCTRFQDGAAAVAAQGTRRAKGEEVNEMSHTVEWHTKAPHVSHPTPTNTDRQYMPTVFLASAVLQRPKAHSPSPLSHRHHYQKAQCSAAPSS
eukprot:1158652-Pelagomonas_calceolata.AAC.3